MTRKRFLNFIVLNSYFLLLLIHFANFKPTPTSGPFRSVLLSDSECTNTSRPKVKNPPFIFKSSITNEPGKPSLLNGNFTVLRDTKNTKFKVRNFILRFGKWEVNNIINNIDCHGLMMHMLCVATKIKYDRKTCMYFKGSYSYTNLDINEMQHLWTSTLVYGRMLWRVESMNSAGTIFCREYNTISEPAQVP